MSSGGCTQTNERKRLYCGQSLMTDGGGQRPGALRIDTTEQHMNEHASSASSAYPPSFTHAPTLCPWGQQSPTAKPDTQMNTSSIAR
eukprot:132334-Chlamydomonas_euryale.AAC.3